jgi:glycosyltransferase involved in cell wall biosynthesis
LGLKAVDGFLFAARPLAKEWIAMGLISSADKVYEVMETSTPFQYQHRASARAITGLTGCPILLWTGRLNANKDPLTVLDGFGSFVRLVPEARLYMAYLNDDLLQVVKTHIQKSDDLRRTVTLLGHLPHNEVEAYYNSADIFVQGSRHEGSGIAVLDAMACGVLPVVTDIPSFRLMTDGGRIGVLWPAGDAGALAESLLKVWDGPLTERSAEAANFFIENWHFEVIGRRAVSVYNEILARKRHRREIQG